jgi:hypothetical protein
MQRQGRRHRDLCHWLEDCSQHASAARIQPMSLVSGPFGPACASVGPAEAQAVGREHLNAHGGGFHLLPGADPGTIEVTVEHSTVRLRAQRSAHYSDADHLVAAERPQEYSAVSSLWAKASTPTT